MANERRLRPLKEVAHVVMGYSPKGDTYNFSTGDPVHHCSESVFGAGRHSVLCTWIDNRADELGG